MSFELTTPAEPEKTLVFFAVSQLSFRCGERETLILATNSLTVVEEAKMFGTYSIEFLGCEWPENPGLYLFEGHYSISSGSYHDSEPELDWHGKVRPVSSHEIKKLLAMTPGDL